MVEVVLVEVVCFPALLVVEVGDYFRPPNKAGVLEHRGQDWVGDCLVRHQVLVPEACSVSSSNSSSNNSKPLFSKLEGWALEQEAWEPVVLELEAWEPVVLELEAWVSMALELEAWGLVAWGLEASEVLVVWEPVDWEVGSF